MSTTHQLSLPVAILININIMLGAGIFINTVELAKRAGIFGALSYTLVGILMLPLILSIAQLLNKHPAGGFYIFGKEEISPFAGFMSAWSYFASKLASAMLIIHTAVLLIQQVIPTIAYINTYALDLGILTSFIALNMLNIKTGSTIQSIFFSLKLIPIFFVILAGLWLLYGNTVHAVHGTLTGIPSTLPLVLYALIGFEAACSLSSKIKDAHRNAPRAIFISYAVVIIITSTYQLLLYSGIGAILTQLANYREVYPALLQFLFTQNNAIQNTGATLLHLAIAASALGGSYGILFSNSWNLYTLAQHKHIIKASWFTQLNNQYIPWLCVLAEGILCALYLFITGGRQIPLQQTSALGSVCAYTISVIALLYAKKNRTDITISWWIPALGLFNCAMFLSSCIYNLIYNGTDALFLYTFLLIAGACMFWYTQRQSTTAIST